MENIVCIGTVACNIGQKLKSKKNYKIYYLDDSDLSFRVAKSSFKKIEKYESPEKYEELYDEGTDDFLLKVKDNATFIVCGASLASGALMRIMQGVNSRVASGIRVLYVKPETDLLSETKKLQEKLVRNVLQQYARSGVLRFLSLVSNESLTGLLGEVSLLQHFDKINEIIATTFHMVNVFGNTKSVVDTLSPPRPTSRIRTYSVFQPVSEEQLVETKLYPLVELAEAQYYYGIPSEDLKSEKDLYRLILAEMKKRLENFPKVSYGIYETSYDTKIGYGVLYSSKIQEEG